MCCPCLLSDEFTYKSGPGLNEASSLARMFMGSCNELVPSLLEIAPLISPEMFFPFLVTNPLSPRPSLSYTLEEGDHWGAELIATPVSSSPLSCQHNKCQGHSPLAWFVVFPFPSFSHCCLRLFLPIENGDARGRHGLTRASTQLSIRIIASQMR